MNKRKTPGKQIKPPHIPKQELEKGLPEESLLDRAYYSQLALSHDDFTGQVTEHVSFDQIVFQQVRMSKTQLKKVQILDSRLIVCDFCYSCPACSFDSYAALYAWISIWYKKGLL